MLELDGSEIPDAPPFDEMAEPVHFSELKEMHKSPAHYRTARQRSKEPTRDMLVGTVVHHLVCGPHRAKPLVRYPNKERKGNAWKDFREAEKARNPHCDIVTDPEWADAEPIATAVLADPVARPLIEVARREVQLKWKSGPIDRETHGIDLVGPNFIADLKRTSCTEVAAFSRHAAKQHWHCQLADYEEACKQNNIRTSGGVYLIGVEPKPPYAVTVLRLGVGDIEVGAKSLAKWLERLIVCRENDHWPTYAQRITDFEMPAWLGDEDAEDSEDA